jgi:hypothetical protein
VEFLNLFDIATPIVQGMVPSGVDVICGQTIVVNDFAPR